MNHGAVKTSTSQTSHWSDALGSPRLWAGQGVLLGALSLSALVRIPLPFTPVPLTLQVLVVFLAALFLGGRASLPVIGGYLVLGAAGLPVFSGGTAGLGHLFGATGGYLMGFFLAAWAVGTWISRPESVKESDRSDRSDKSDASDKSTSLAPPEIARLRRDAAVLALGLVLIYGFGSLWLAAMTHTSFEAVISMAVAPFVILDVVKVSAAYTLYRLTGRAVGRFLA